MALVSRVESCLKCGLKMSYAHDRALYLCYNCNIEITEECVNDLALVRGAFVHLFAPSLRAMLLGGSNVIHEMQFVEEQDRMAILHPDTSKVPIWRRQPTRVEHPISAWRCWGIEKKDDGWILSSVACSFFWEGPVVRAHKRPVDPKYWDGKKPDKKDARDEREFYINYQAYYEEMRDTFAIAGIHALKTKDQAIEAAGLYQVSCYGEVGLWGRVVQFELGYRAEACMIRRLFLFNLVEAIFNGRNDHRDYDVIEAKKTDLVNSLSRRYGCEVTIV